MRASIKGVTPEWFAIPATDNKPDPPEFYINPLDGLKAAELLMEFYNPATGVVSGPGIIKAFRLSVTNWRNIEDADQPGVQLPFSTLAMGKLWPAWIMEVGKRALEISNINEDESKNSASPSSSPEI